MTKLDGMALFLKDLVVNKNKQVFTVDELTDEIMKYFKLRNINTASGYIQIMAETLKYIEWVPRNSFRVIYCDNYVPEIIHKEKKSYTIEELEEQNYQIYKELKSSLSSVFTPELLEQNSSDWYNLIKQYTNNQRKIQDKKELKQWYLKKNQCIIIEKKDN